MCFGDRSKGGNSIVFIGCIDEDQAVSVCAPVGEPQTLLIAYETAEYRAEVVVEELTQRREHLTSIKKWC